jgi:DNA-binding transcriptional ArsR family regulator
MLKQSAPLDLMFQALADPVRRSLVDRLTEGPASVSDLARPLEMTLSGVVQHLKVLEASGLIRSSKTGRVRTFELVPAALRRAEHWLSGRWLLWNRRLNRLGEYLASQPDD